MADAIDRAQMRGKIRRMADRCKQRRDGAYKVGYSDACKDAMQKLYECTSLETCSVTRCKDCRHANERRTTQPFCTIHSRRRAPDDYCNFGEPEE